MKIINDVSKMHRTKLIKLLKTLSKEEYLRFGKFLRSPFFNTKPALIEFYERLKRHHPTFDSPRLKIEKLWAHVFPDKAFTEQKFRQLCSDLGKLAERYLIQLELEQPENKTTHLLIRSLRRRNEYDLFEKQIKTRIELLDETVIKDATWYKERMELLEYHYFHPLYNKQAKKDDKLMKLMDSMDAYFLFQKMKVGIGLVNQQKILKQDYDIRFLAILEEDKGGGFLEDNLLYQLYQTSFDLLQKGDEFDFFKIEELLFNNHLELKLDDQKLFFFNGLNYAVGKLNQGESKFGKELLKWYKFGLSKEILFPKGLISVSTFQNIIHVSCQNKEFDYVKDFIESYQFHLKEELRKESVAYGWGLFYFYQKKLDEAISILIKENWEKSHQLSGRNLLVRAHFENYLRNRDQFYFLQNAIHAFEIYLIRTKEFPKAYLESHLNLMRILKALSKKIDAFASKEIIQLWLDKQVQKRKRVISKSWLSNLDF